MPPGLTRASIPKTAASLPAPQYSKKEVVAAGRILAERSLPLTNELAEAFHIAHAWRTAHALPMRRVRDDLKGKMRRSGGTGLTAARIKRMASIRAKLARTWEDEAISRQSVEVQLRTRLQHVWSTAVEAVGLTQGVGYKVGEGPETWRRLFVRMSGSGYFLVRFDRRQLDPEWDRLRRRGG